MEIFEAIRLVSMLYGLVRQYGLDGALALLGSCFDGIAAGSWSACWAVILALFDR